MENAAAFASAAAAGMAVGPVPSHHGGMRVLLVEEDAYYLAALTDKLQSYDYKVTAMASHEEGLRALQENPEGSFDLVMTVVRTQGPGGIDGFELLRHAAKPYPVLMFSHFEPTEVMMRAMLGGACGFLTKPLHEDVVRNVWHHVIQRKIIQGSAAADVVVAARQDDTAAAAAAGKRALDGSGEGGSQLKRKWGRPSKKIDQRLHPAFVRAAEQLRGTEAMEIDELKEGSGEHIPPH